MDWKVIASTILITSASVFGQEATSKKIVLPSGEVGYSIRCDNMNMNFCYEKAGEVCFRGYDIQSENKEQGQEARGGTYVGPGLVAGSALGVSSSTSRTTSEKGLLILCKEPQATERERASRNEAQEKRRLQREQDVSRARDSERGTFALALGGTVLIAFVLLVASSQ